MPTATTPLTPKQIEGVMQNVVIDALGLTPGPAAFKAVRVGWQQQGQPAFEIDEDVATVICEEVDEPYNRVRDLALVPTPGGPVPPTVDLVTSYTRCWELTCIIYGPNCYDNARKVHSALLRPDQTIHDLLVTASLYLVPDMPAPRYLPEAGPGKQWWYRTDFTAQFYEQVMETVTVPTVGSVEVIVQDPSQISVSNPTGTVADVTISGG